MSFYIDLYCIQYNTDLNDDTNKSSAEVALVIEIRKSILLSI